MQSRSLSTKVSLGLLAGLAAMAATTFARAEPPASVLIGNTLKLTTRGQTIAYAFKPHNRVVAQIGQRTRMSGTYRFAGTQICLKLGMGGFTGPETCVPFSPSQRRVGDSWDTTFNGVTTHGEIVAGQTF